MQRTPLLMLALTLLAPALFMGACALDVGAGSGYVCAGMARLVVALECGACGAHTP